MMRLALFNRARTTRTSLKQKRKQRGFNLESLEDRRVLTIGVTWDGGSGVLTVSGSNSDDSIVVGATDEAEPKVTINGMDTTQLGATTNSITADAVVGISIEGNAGEDSIDASDVSAADFTSLANVTADGGSGDDVIVGSDLSDTIVGGLGSDHLFGASGEDVLSGDEGNDVLYGGTDDDVVSGGDGDDILIGGSGVDAINGGDGLENIEIADDLDTSSVAFQGLWTVDSAAGINGSQRVIAANETDSLASWKFTNLPTNRYQVFVTWESLPSANLSTEAPFAVIGGTNGASVAVVDQSQDPTGNTLADTNWHSLGVFRVVDGELEVQATSSRLGAVAADAVRIQPLANNFAALDISGTESVELANAPNGSVTADFQLELDSGGHQVVSWSVDWGDGSQTTLDGTQSFASHSYNSEGTYEVRATALTAGGTEVVRSKSLNVSHLPGANLLKNPSFEENPISTGFESQSFAEINAWNGFSRDPVTISKFANSQTLGLGGDSASGVTQTVKTIEGQRYIFSARHRSGVGTDHSVLGLSVLDEVTGRHLRNEQFTATDDWASASIVFTASSGSSQLRITDVIPEGIPDGPELDPPIAEVDDTWLYPVILETTEDTRIERFVLLPDEDPFARPEFSGITITPTNSGFSISSDGIVTFDPGDQYQVLNEGDSRLFEVKFVTAANTPSEEVHRVGFVVDGRNDAPTAQALIVSAPPVSGQPLLLEIAGASDVDSQIGAVTFLRDTGNGVAEEFDEFLAIDSIPQNGWSISIPPGEWEVEDSRYYAILSDEALNFSDALTIDIANPYDLGGLVDVHADFSDLISNGGFENPGVLVSRAFGGGTVPGWDPAPHSPPIEIHQERMPLNFSYTWEDSQGANGDQWLELDSRQTLVQCTFRGKCDTVNYVHSSSTIVQDATVTPWRPYRLSFDFAARPGTSGLDNQATVSILEPNVLDPDGPVVRESRSFAADPVDALEEVVWYSESVVFTPRTNLVQLAFEDTGVSDQLGTFIDNVRLEPIVVPNVTIVPNAAPFMESDEAELLVELDAPAYDDVSLFYRLVEGTAQSRADFAPIHAGFLQIPKGETSTTLPLPIVDDDVREEDGEAFDVEIYFANNAQIDGTLTTTVHVDDDDFAPAIISIGTAVRPEGAVSLRIPITVDGNVGSVDTTLQFVEGKFDGTQGADQVAALGTDFSVSGINASYQLDVSFDAIGEETTHFVDVDLIDNEFWEPSKYFAAELLDSQPSFSVEIDSSSNVADMTITNDDEPAILRVYAPEYRVREAVGSIDLTVQLEGFVENSFQGSLIGYGGFHEAPGDTATYPHATAGSDYTLPSGFNLSSNSTATVTVPLLIDPVEGTEYFHFELHETGTDGVVVDPISSLAQVILLGDAEPIEYSIHESYVIDPDVDPSSTQAQVVIQLSEPVPDVVPGQDTVTINYETIGFTAVEGFDYTAVNSTAVIGEGGTQAIVDIPLLSDGLQNGTRKFFLNVKSIQSNNGVEFVDPEKTYAPVYVTTGQTLAPLSGNFGDDDQTPQLTHSITPWVLDSFKTVITPWREAAPDSDGLPVDLLTGAFSARSQGDAELSYSSNPLTERIMEVVQVELPNQLPSGGGQLPSEILRFEIILSLYDQQLNQELGKDVLTFENPVGTADELTANQIITLAHEIEPQNLDADLASGIYVLVTEVRVELEATDSVVQGELQTLSDIKTSPYLYNSGIYTGQNNPLAAGDLRRLYEYQPRIGIPDPELGYPVIGYGVFGTDGSATYFGELEPQANLDNDPFQRHPGVFSQLVRVTGDESDELRRPPNDPVGGFANFQLIHPDSSKTIFRRPDGAANGFQTYTADSYGNATRYVYDPAFGLSSIIDPFGVVTTYSYERTPSEPDYGLLESVQKWLGTSGPGAIAPISTTSLDYQFMNSGSALSKVIISHPIPRIGEVRPTEEYRFDDTGRLSTFKNTSGRIDSYVYEGEYLAEFHEASAEWHLTPAILNIFSADTDDAGMVGSVTRDALFATTTTNPRGFDTEYKLHVDGNIESKTDARGNNYSYTYYPNYLQLKTATEPDPDNLTAYKNSNYSIDYGDSLVVGVDDVSLDATAAPNKSYGAGTLGERTTTFYYDFSDLSQTDHPFANSFTVEHPYVGAVTRIEYPSGASENWTYGWNTSSKQFDEVAQKFSGTPTSYIFHDPIVSSSNNTIHDGSVRHETYEIDWIDSNNNGTFDTWEVGGNFRTVTEHTTVATLSVSSNETGDPRCTYPGSANSWISPGCRFFVSFDDEGINDENVSAIDALLVINELEREQYHTPPSAFLDADLNMEDLQPRPSDSTIPYYDVSNDRQISPNDALRVINVLSSGGLNPQTTQYNVHPGITAGTFRRGFTYTTNTDNVPRGMPKTETDHEGYTTEYFYYSDDQSPSDYANYGLVHEIEYGSSSNHSWLAMAQFTYDGRRQPLTVQEPTKRSMLLNPRVTTYDYDSLDRLRSVTEPAPDGQAGPTRTYEYNGDGQVRSMTDENGITTSYAYDSQDRLWRVCENSANCPVSGGNVAVTNTVRDKMGNVIKHVATNGETTLFAYDELDRLVYEVQLELTDGDPLPGPATHYVVDNVGNVVAVVDPDNNVTEYRYDTNDNLVAMFEDRQGLGSSHAAISLNPADQPSRFNQNELRPITDYTFDALGQLRSVVDPLGHETDFEYNERGEKIRVRRPHFVGDAQSMSVYQYDSDGNLLTSIDAHGNQTFHQYDGLNHRFKTTQPTPQNDEGQLRPVTEFKHDGAGNLTEIYESHSDRRTVLQYDPNGRLSDLIYPRVRVIGLEQEVTPIHSFGYDPEDNLIWEKDPFGTLTEYRYDEFDRLIFVVGTNPHDFDRNPSLQSELPVSLPESEAAVNTLRQDTNVDTKRPVTVYEYLPRGGYLQQVVETIGIEVGIPVERETAYRYDGLGRLEFFVEPDPINGTAQIDAAGVSGQSPFTQYSYSLAGDLESVTDGNSNQTTFVYDNLRRMVERIQPGAGSPTTEFVYDAAGQLESLTDPVGNVTTWQYNGLGLVTNERGRSYEYDLVGNLTRAIDRESRVIEYEYDNLHQLQEEKWLNGTFPNTIEFDYGDAGNISETRDGNHIQSFTHDPLDRIVDESIVFGSNPDTDPQAAVNQMFDVGGNVRQVLLGSEGIYDSVTTYEYDALQRVASIAQQSFSGQEQASIAGYSIGTHTVASKHVAFEYDLVGQFDTISRFDNPDGVGAPAVTTDFGFDSTGRVELIKHDSNLTLARYDFEYDRGSRLSEMDFLGADNIEDVDSFEYNERDELLDVNRSAAILGEILDESFRYDANGNRISVDATGDGGTVTYGTPASFNEVFTDGEFTYEYDDEGNIIQRSRTSNALESKTYEWDNRNRLVRVKEFDPTNGSLQKTIEYTYNAFNQLISKTVDGNSHTYFVNESGQIALKLQSTGTDSPDVTNRYLWGPAIDQVISDEDADAATFDWALTDHLGSVRDWVDSTGTEISLEHLAYDSFGNIIDIDVDPVTGDLSVSPGTTDHLFAFTGRMFDQETGLQNNLHRWYDPKIGRWMNEDPIGFAAGDANLHRYVGNEPTGLTDPSGLEATVGQKLAEGFGKLKPAALRKRFNEAMDGAKENLADAKRIFREGIDEFVNSGPRIKKDLADAKRELKAKADELRNTSLVLGIFVEPLDWINTAIDIYEDPTSPFSYAGLLPMVPAMGSKVDDLARVFKWCFAPDTLVQTPEGKRRIDEISVGDKVLAFDFEKGDWRAQPVVRCHRNRYEGAVVSVVTDHCEFVATAYHPIWVLEGYDLENRPKPRELADGEDQGRSIAGRWVNSHDILPGDRLLSANGEEVEVREVKQRFEKSFEICNLTVNDNPTFAVGENALLVHNTGGCKAPKGVVDDIAPKVGVRTIDPSTLPLPNGFSNSRFGKLLKWPAGKGNPAQKLAMAKEQLKNIGPDTIAKMKAEGVTSEMLEQWAKFYRAENIRVPQNPTALSRAFYLEELLKHW